MSFLKLSLLILVFTLAVFSLSGKAEPTFLTRRPRTRPYIEATCKTTHYPTLCFQYLSMFPDSTIQSPQQLAQVSLSVSLYRAQFTRSYMLKVAGELKAEKAKDYQLVKDCLDQINDGVEQLSQSITELRRLGGQESPVKDDAFWHISNVESWVSAALTDATTCVDAFPGRNMSKLKATIKGKVLNVAQTTSNALALFHRYAAIYRSRASNQKP
ncbi:hypothetical protein K2173_024843 [Erythroxylum novogranatense]|uniref:Pectinesterase inhibitor domain-containing protein n=1 Tax=Erythroxylum novogranatense TaxID=1862640 RepID=A0AAV8UGM1_9ROSI|nr:hypothetical protein K2173_024843 [Erythroxylum novogranatense]